jgi:hypothetical protein
MADNQRMQRFLFWARVMAENAVLRHTWLGLRELGALSQSQALQRLSAWMELTDDPAALPLAASLARSLGAPGELGEALSYLFGDPAAKQLLRRWWRESIRPVLPTERVAVLDDIFGYDLLTQPVYHHPEASTRAEELPVVRLGGQEYFLRTGALLDYDVPGILAALRAGQPPDLEPARSTVDLYYPVGAEQTVTSTNHETIMHFMGTVLDAVTVAQSTDDVPPTDPARALIADRGGCA